MDHIFERPEGWYCRVNGQMSGPWMCREYAVAGMQVEQRRADRKLREAIAVEVKDAL